MNNIFRVLLDTDSDCVKKVRSYRTYKQKDINFKKLGIHTNKEDVSMRI